MVIFIYINQSVLIYLFIKFSQPITYQRKLSESDEDTSSNLDEMTMKAGDTTETDSKFARFVSDNILHLKTEEEG